MKRTFALLALAWFPLFARAAEPVAPAVEIRVKAIGDLAGIVEYAGATLLQPEAGKQFAEMITTLGAGDKGLEGIDTGKPIGGYVRISENIADSAVVVLVPVKDEAAFVALLKNKLNVDPKKGKEDIYSIDISQLPVGAVYFRFLHGYAYATIRNVKSIDPDSIIQPKDFFKTPLKQVLAADIYWDRFPADVKKVMLGQIELQLAEMTKDFGGSELQKQARRGLIDIGVGMVQTILNDGEKFGITLDADPKTDAISADIRMTAKAKSTFAANLKSWADRESLAAGVSVGKNPLASLSLIAKLPSGTHEKLGKLIDVLFDDALAGANDDAKPHATKLVEAVSPTVKSEDLQLGLFIGKNAKGDGLSLHAAVKADKGDAFEKTVKEFAPFLMGGEAIVKFDEDKVAGRNLHKGEFTNLKLKDPFGTETIWIATSDDLVAIGIEDEPKLLKAYLEAKPKKLPMLALEISATQFGHATQTELAPDKYAAAVESVFGKTGPAGRDTLKLTVTGGDELNVKIVLKGSAVKFFATFDQLKKK